MKIIVTKDYTEDMFSQFRVVNSLATLSNNDAFKTEPIEVLVINNFIEDDFNAGVFLSRLKQQGNIDLFLYINEDPSMTIRMLMNGLGGHVETDTFYLEDENELCGLIADIQPFSSGDKAESTSIMASTNIVREFVEAFARGDSQIKSQMYLQRVNEALNNMNTVVEIQHAQLVAMGDSAIEVFHKASDIIGKIHKKNQEIAEQLRILENKDDMTSSSGGSRAFGGTTMFYPTFKINQQGKNILLIRELSPTPYLTSFLLGYEYYVHYDLNKRVKLVFIHNKGYGYKKKYENICTSITEDSENMDGLYNKEIIDTNNPIKDVLKKLLDDPVDLYIFVDRLYGKDDIITGRLNKLNAISGTSDLTKYGVKAKDCITSINAVEGNLINIPSFNGYPAIDKENARRMAYNQYLKKDYQKLDDVVGFIKD